MSLHDSLTDVLGVQMLCEDSKLSQRETDVIFLRFVCEHTLARTGELSNGVSVTRAREIEQKALRKLRKFCRRGGKKIEDYGYSKWREA